MYCDLINRGSLLISISHLLRLALCLCKTALSWEHSSDSLFFRVTGTQWSNCGRRWMDTCQCLLKLILLLVSFLDPTYQRFWYAWCWKSLWPGGVALLYLFCTLGRFGFGPNFILLVKTLYPPQWQWFAPNKIRSALFPRNSISVYQMFVKFVQFMSVESCVLIKW